MKVQFYPQIWEKWLKRRAFITRKGSELSYSISEASCPRCGRDPIKGLVCHRGTKAKSVAGPIDKNNENNNSNNKKK